MTIQARKLLMNIHLPEELEGILFIENLDSYTRAVTQTSTRTQHPALVYCAGFRSGAQRVPQHAGVSLHYHEASRTTVQKNLEAWWFEGSGPDYPCSFWGDLDFASMGILKALRQRFPRIEAWQPGYAPSSAHKQEQLDPGKTGCTYADKVLLPALRRHGLCVDQEMIWDGWDA